MRFMSRRASAALVVAALWAGCSSSNSNKDGSGSGYGPSTKLVDLSGTDVSQLCTQESANGNGKVSCLADASVNVVPLGVCTSFTPDCSATVATSQVCAAMLNADACSPEYTADMRSPSCLVMRACTNSLCDNAMCYCPDYNSLSTCLTTCKRFTAGLTIDCATCIAGLFGPLMCPDFTMLQPPYDQCASVCAHTDGGAGRG
jgi:hypothetical protein